MSSLPDAAPMPTLAVARPDDPDLLPLAVVGDTYTVLLSGKQTAGRFTLIDMLIPAGGGPPAHRHAFEECFHVVEGSVEVTLREDPPVRLWAGRRSTSQPTRPTPSVIPATSRHACSAPPCRPGWRDSLPSSVTASIRGRHPRRRSRMRKSMRVYGARPSALRTTAWNC